MGNCVGFLLLQLNKQSIKLIWVFNAKSLQKESCFGLETFANPKWCGYNMIVSAATVLQLPSLVHLTVLASSSFQAALRSRERGQAPLLCLLPSLAQQVKETVRRVHPTSIPMDKMPPTTHACAHTVSCLLSANPTLKDKWKGTTNNKKNLKKIPAQHVGTSWSQYLRSPAKIISASESGLSDPEQSNSDIFLSCHHFGLAVELSYLDIAQRQGIYSFSLVGDRRRSDNTSLCGFFKSGYKLSLFSSLLLPTVHYEVLSSGLVFPTFFICVIYTI